MEGTQAVLARISAVIANRQLGLQPSELAEYKAARNWLRRCDQTWQKVSHPNQKHLAQVRGHLEAFFHLGNVADWESASQVVMVPTDATGTEELHRLLFVWGYYKEQKELYEALLYQVSREVDLVCLSGLGSLHDVLGEYSDAIALHQQALTLAKAMETVAAQGSALGALGNAYLSMGEHERAIAHYQQSLKIARAENEMASVGIALGNLGNAYRVVEAYDLAYECLQERLAIARTLSDLKGEGDGLCNLGSLYSMQGKRDKAKKVLGQAVKMAQAKGHRLGECRALGNLGLVYVEEEENGYAVDCFEQALKITREIRDREGERLAIVQLGSLCQKLNQYERAFRYQQAALGFIEDAVQRAALLLNLGTDCRDMGRWEEAIALYQELQTTAVLMEADAAEKRLLEMMALYCLALVYQTLGKLKTAFRYCRAALDLSHESVAPLIDRCLDLQAELGVALFQASEESA